MGTYFLDIYHCWILRFTSSIYLHCEGCNHEKITTSKHCPLYGSSYKTSQLIYHYRILPKVSFTFSQSGSKYKCKAFLTLIKSHCRLAWPFPESWMTKIAYVTETCLCIWFYENSSLLVFSYSFWSNPDIRIGVLFFALKGLTLLFFLININFDSRSFKEVKRICLSFWVCRGSLYRLLHRPNRELDERRRVRMALDVVSIV